MQFPGGHSRRFLLFVLSLVLFCTDPMAQGNGIIKQHYSDFWGGFNIDLRLSKRWSLLSENEYRRKEFLAEPNLVYTALGAQYHFFKGLNAHVAVGHQWKMVEEPYSLLSVGETRAQVQVVYQQTVGRFRFRERLRNEFRWLDRLPGDNAPGKEFHDRIRALVGAEFKLFDNKWLPSLVGYDEYLVETVSGFSHPSFNQNRLFFGIRQAVTRSFTFDLGYMNVLVSADDPGIREIHDVMRLHLSWSPDPFRKHDSNRKTAEPSASMN